MALAKDFKITVSVDDKTGKSFAAIDSQADGLTATVKQLNAIMVNLQSTLAQLTPILTKANATQEKYATSMEDTGQSMAQLNSVNSSGISIWKILTGALVGAGAAMAVNNQAFMTSISAIPAVKNNIIPLVESVSLLKAAFMQSAESVLANFTPALSAVSSGFKNMIGQVPLFTNMTKTAMDAFGKFRDILSAGAATASKVAGPALLNVAYNLKYLALPLAFLGTQLLNADNQFLKFLGTVSIVAATIGAGFGLVLKMIIDSVSGLAIAVGENLLSVMDKFDEKFIKSQQVMTQFSYVISGFSRELGEAAVGSLGKWTAVLEELKGSTKFATNDIAKAIKVLVAETARYGISVEDTEKLIKRTSDIASAFSEDIVDVSQKMAAAFAGSTQSLQNMGFAVSDAAFAHSDLYLAMGKTREQLSKSQEAAIRFDLIMKSSSATAGAAANELNTVAGANALLDKTVTDLGAKLGGQAALIAFLQTKFTKLLTVLVDLPTPLVRFVGSLTEFVGYGLVAAGFMVKQILLLSLLTAAYAALTKVLATNVTAQVVATEVFRRLSVVIGVETVAITSLTGVWTNLLILLRGGAVLALSKVGSILASVGTAMMAATRAGLAFAASILVNPIFLKAAAIVLALGAMAVAIQDMFREISFLKDMVDKLGQVWTSVFGKAKESTDGLGSSIMDTLIGAFKSLFDILVNYMKISFSAIIAQIIVVIKLMLPLVQSLYMLRNAFGTAAEDVELFNKKQEELTKMLVELGDYATHAAAGIGDIATGSTKAGAAVGAYGAKVDQTSEILQKFIAIHMKDFNEARERIKALGTEFEKTAVKYEESQIAMAKAQASTMDIEKKAEAIAKAQQDVVLAGLEKEKQVRDTLKDIGEQKRKAEIEALKSSGRTVQAIQLENQEKMSALEKQIAGAKLLGNLTKEQIDLIEKSKEAVKRAAAADVRQEQAKLTKEAQQNALSQYNSLIDLQKSLDEYIMKSGKSEEDQIIEVNKRRQEEIDKLRSTLDAVRALTPEREMAIQLLEKTLKIQEKLAIQELKDKELKKDRDKAIRQIEELANKTRDLMVENEKRNKTMLEQIDIEQSAAIQQAKDLEAQLSQLGILDSATQAIIDQFKAAQAAKAAFAAQDIGLEDIALRDLAGMIPKINWKQVGASFVATMDDAFGDIDTDNLFASIGDKLMSLGEDFVDLISNIDWQKAGSGLLDMAMAAGSALMDQLGQITLGDIADSIESAFSVASDLLTGEFLNQFTDAITTMGDIPQQLLDGFKNLDQIISKFVSELPTIINKFFTEFPKLIDKIAAALPKMLAMLTDALPKIFNSLVAAIPKLLQAFLDALPQMITAFGQILQKMIAAIPGLVKQIMAALPEIITAIIQAVPGIMQELFKAIPEIIQAIDDKMPAIIESLTSGLIEAGADIGNAFVEEMVLHGGIERMIQSQIKAAPRIAMALVNGVVEGLAKAFKSLGKLISGTFDKIELPEEIKKLPEKITEAVKKLGKNIAKDASQIFAVKDLEDAVKGLDPTKELNKALGKIPEAIVKGTFEAANNFKTWLKDAWDWVLKNLILNKWFFDALLKAFTWVFEEILNPLYILLREVWLKVLDEILDPLYVLLKACWVRLFKDLILPCYDLLRAAWLKVLTVLIFPLFNLLFASWDLLLAKIINPLFDVLKIAWLMLFTAIVGPLLDCLRSAWLQLFTGLVEPLLTLLTQAWNGAWKVINESLSKFMGTLAGVFDGGASNLTAATGGLSVILSGIPELFRKGGDYLTGAGGVIGAVFNGLFEGLKNIWSGFNDLVRPIFDGLSSAFRSLTQGFASIFNRLIDMLNNLKVGPMDWSISAGKLGKASGQLIPEIDFIPGNIPRIEGFAQGGTVPGTPVMRGVNSLINDKVLGLLSPGERVIPLEVLSNPLVAKFVDMLIAGRGLFDSLMAVGGQPFAVGGAVGQSPGSFAVNRRRPMNMTGFNQVGFEQRASGISIAAININAKTNLDAEGIRREVIPAIERHLKRRSQDGEFVLSSKGVRS